MNVSRFDTPADCIDYDPRLAHVDCMVLATHEEQYQLWEAHASESDRRTAPGLGLPWKDDVLGRGTCVGVVDGLPLCVTWSFAVVADAVLCFYEVTSQAQDQEQVQRWADAICTRGVAAHNFGRAPGYIQPSATVAKYEAARKRLFDQMQADREAKYAADMARRAAMVRDPGVLAMIAAGLPQIDDDQLAERSAAIAPLVEWDGSLWYIDPGPDLRGVSFTWSESWTEPANDLVPATQVHTLHRFGYYGFFKPSIAEVLAQAPDDMHEYAAFSVKGPGDAVDLSLYPEAINAGYHVATVTYYRKATKP